METLCVPLARPAPDWRRFIKAVTTPYEPPRVALVEYLMNPPIQQAIVEMMGRTWVEASQDRQGYWDNFIEIWRRLGYDFVRMEMAMPFPGLTVRAGKDDGRSFAETATGPIQTWEDFHKYAWPGFTDEDFADHHHVSSHLPEGMGLISCHACGPLEWIDSLMGYENLCIALYEQPDLVAAVAGKIDELVSQYVKRLLEVPNLIAYFQGDDMGFRTGTLVSPQHLRKYVLPIHKRFANMAHERGIPYFLHSCGQITEVMGDLIDDVRIDAKHSFEDAIMPVQEWKRRYGSQIGILGGIDVDKLARWSTADLRKHVRRVIDDCAPGGRFALGSGNSIPEYVPVENFLTMLDEALR